MEQNSYGLVGGLGAIGALIGFGQLLLSDEPVTWRRAAGRAIVTGGASVGAASILIWIPGLPMVAVVGLGAAIGSLGATGLERLLLPIIQRFVPGVQPAAPTPPSDRRE